MDEIKELYIEPTTYCNLNCTMCSRKSWKNELKGHMERELFDKIIREIPESVERIFFGGIGEPLFHPDILYMLNEAKRTGRKVEMITNGTLLDREISREIVKIGIDTLWISLDSVEQESYEKIRFGADYPDIKMNIRGFNRERNPAIWDPVNSEQPETAKVKLGIAFVLMKSNLLQYKELLSKARSLGIERIKASHLIPHDESQIEEICYKRIFDLRIYDPPSWANVKVDMPFLDTRDIDELDMLPLFSDYSMSYSIMGSPIAAKPKYCRFAQEGIAFVRWDAEVCPCAALLHDNTVFQQNRKRQIRHCSFGNVRDSKLIEIWENEPYFSFRRRVKNFEFSPCSHCATCDLFESNEEDCSGNTFPVCGACLWARDLIQCP